MSDDDNDIEVAPLDVSWVVPELPGDNQFQGVGLLGPTGRVLHREKSIVTKPTDEEMARALAERPCCNCYHFSHRHGQEEMRHQRFITGILYEHGWQPEWAGNPHDYGLCTLRGDEITSAWATCDEWKERKGRLGRFFRGVGRRLSGSR